MEPQFTAQNPIVAAAERIRARREIDGAIDAQNSGEHRFEDAESGLRALAETLTSGCKRINAILGERNGVRLVRLERPLRLRLRFGEKRIAFELDEMHQLVRLAGIGLDGEYQFIPDTEVPALLNVSIVSTESGYGDALTASSLLKRRTQDAELPRPPHLDGEGPLQF